MPCSARARSSSGRLKCGSRRLYGTERTSATAVTPALRNRPKSAGHSWFEWPMLNNAFVVDFTICNPAWASSIIAATLTHRDEVAHRGDDPARLDAAGAELLPGGRGGGQGRLAHCAAHAGAQPRRADSQVWLAGTRAARPCSLGVFQ